MKKEYKSPYYLKHREKIIERSKIRYRRNKENPIQPRERKKFIEPVVEVSYEMDPKYWVWQYWNIVVKKED
jgi:hypothetical protein